MFLKKFKPPKGYFVKDGTTSSGGVSGVAEETKANIFEKNLNRLSGANNIASFKRSVGSRSSANNDPEDSLEGGINNANVIKIGETGDDDLVPQQQMEQIEDNSLNTSVDLLGEDTEAEDDVVYGPGNIPIGGNGTHANGISKVEPEITSSKYTPKIKRISPIKNSFSQKPEENNSDYLQPVDYEENNSAPVENNNDEEIINAQQVYGIGDAGKTDLDTQPQTEQSEEKGDEFFEEELASKKVYGPGNVDVNAKKQVITQQKTQPTQKNADTVIGKTTVYAPGNKVVEDRENTNTEIPGSVGDSQPANNISRSSKPKSSYSNKTIIFKLGQSGKTKIAQDKITTQLGTSKYSIDLQKTEQFIVELGRVNSLFGLRKINRTNIKDLIRRYKFTPKELKEAVAATLVIGQQPKNDSSKKDFGAGDIQAKFKKNGKPLENNANQIVKDICHEAFLDNSGKSLKERLILAASKKFGASRQIFDNDKNLLKALETQFAQSDYWTLEKKGYEENDAKSSAVKPVVVAKKDNEANQETQKIIEEIDKGAVEPNPSETKTNIQETGANYDNLEAGVQEQVTSTSKAAQATQDVEDPNSLMQPELYAEADGNAGDYSYDEDEEGLSSGQEPSQDYIPRTRPSTGAKNDEVEKDANESLVPQSEEQINENLGFVPNSQTQEGDSFGESGQSATPSGQPVQSFGGSQSGSNNAVPTRSKSGSKTFAPLGQGVFGQEGDAVSGNSLVGNNSTSENSGENSTSESHSSEHFSTKSHSSNRDEQEVTLLGDGTIPEAEFQPQPADELNTFDSNAEFADFENENNNQNSSVLPGAGSLDDQQTQVPFEPNFEDRETPLIFDKQGKDQGLSEDARKEIRDQEAEYAEQHSKDFDNADEEAENTYRREMKRMEAQDYQDKLDDYKNLAQGVGEEPIYLTSDFYRGLDVSADDLKNEIAKLERERLAKLKEYREEIEKDENDSLGEGRVTNEQLKELNKNESEPLRRAKFTDRDGQEQTVVLPGEGGLEEELTPDQLTDEDVEYAQRQALQNQNQSYRESFDGELGENEDKLNQSDESLKRSQKYSDLAKQALSEKLKKEVADKVKQAVVKLGAQLATAAAPWVAWGLLAVLFLGLIIFIPVLLCALTKEKKWPPLVQQAVEVMLPQCKGADASGGAAICAQNGLVAWKQNADGTWTQVSGSGAGGDGSSDSGVGVGNVPCLAVARTGLYGNAYLRAFMRAISQAESTGSYTIGNAKFGTYGRYQWRTGGSWGYVKGKADLIANTGTFPDNPQNATNPQQDAAFVPAWNGEAGYRGSTDINGIVSLLQSSGIQAALNKANEGNFLSGGTGMCGAWAVLCPSGRQGGQGRQSLITNVYNKVLAEEQSGTCGSTAFAEPQQPQNIAKNQTFDLASYTQQKNWLDQIVGFGSVKAEASSASDALKAKIQSGAIPVWTRNSKDRGFIDKADFIYDIDTQGIDEGLAQLLVDLDTDYPNYTLNALGTQSHGNSGGDHNKTPIQAADIGGTYTGNVDGEEVSKIKQFVEQVEAKGVVKKWGVSPIVRGKIGQDYSKLGIPSGKGFKDDIGHLHISVNPDATYDGDGSGSSTSSIACCPPGGVSPDDQDSSSGVCCIPNGSLGTNGQTNGPTLIGDKQFLNKIPMSLLNPLKNLIITGESGTNKTEAVNMPNQGSTTFTAVFGKTSAETTLNEIYTKQSLPKGQAGKVGAVGWLQVIGSTMKKVMDGLSLSPETKYTEETQDLMFKWLIFYKRPEIGNYLIGKNNNVQEAAQALAREWASFGLAYPEAPAKELQASGVTLTPDHYVKRQIGQSLYQGVNGNKAFISPDKATQVLQQMRKELDGNTELRKTLSLSYNIPDSLPSDLAFENLQESQTTDISNQNQPNDLLSKLLNFGSVKALAVDIPDEGDSNNTETSSLPKCNFVSGSSTSVGTPVNYTGGFIFPMERKVTVTACYGQNSCSHHGHFHKGTDFSSGSGKGPGIKIVATAPGVVISSYNSCPVGAIGSKCGGAGTSGYGNAVILKHNINGETWYSLYGHMFTGSVKVKIGDTVQGGQELGTEGSTGSSSGLHLHFQLGKNDIYNGTVDPCTKFAC